MKLAIVCLLFVIAAISTVNAGQVVDLTAPQWDEVVGKANYTLVKFFAPWCGHCKTLAPEFEKLAELVADNTNIVVADFDCTKEENKELPKQYDVRGFPTLILFKNGEKKLQYSGQRTAEAIKKWLAKKTTTAITTFKTLQEVKDFVAKSTKDAANVLVGYFSSADSDARKEFSKASEDPDADDFVFAELIGEEHKETDKDDHVVLHRHFDTEPVLTKIYDKIVSFANLEGFPLVQEISQAYQRYSKAGKPVGILFTDPSKDNKDTLSQIEQVAKEFKGKISFAEADGVKYAQYAKSIGLSGELPGFIVSDMNKNKNFIPTDPSKVSLEDVTSFIKGVLSGEVTAHVKSQPVPETNDEPVKVIVGKTFDELITNNTEDDILLEFYAEWCGHCKTFAPKYDKLAEQLKGVKNLVIAKIDGSENDTPIQVEGFPTVKFFPAGGKRDVPVDYEGARDVEPLIKFLKENAVASKQGLEQLSDSKDEL